MDRSTIELAIRGLETEKEKIDKAILNLKSELNGRRLSTTEVESHREISGKTQPGRKRKLSAAARKKISEAQKKRWAKAKSTK